MDKLLKRTTLELFREILNDPDRKPLFKIIYEPLYLLFTYRELPVHYFSRYLFKKRISNIEDYLPNKFLGKIPSLFNDRKVTQVLDNKLYFNLFYSQFNISLPKIIMYNHKKLFVVGDKSTEVNVFGDFLDLLEEIFKKYPSWDSVIVKKTYASSFGHNNYKILRNQVKSDPLIIKDIFTEVINSEFLFQETIKQHPDLNKLTSSSLNTIRFDTFIDRDGKIDIISAYIRMSLNNNHVDNISSGGCKVGISLQSGKLKKFGYSMIRTCDLKVLIKHPKTETTFEDFTIPFFSRAKELVLKAATCMPELRLVGWDVAIGESGPVLIEGNSDYDISGNDLADEGYRANIIFRKVLNEMKYS